MLADQLIDAAEMELRSCRFGHSRCQPMLTIELMGELMVVDEWADRCDWTWAWDIWSY
jgi:hypothetical protein